MTKEVSQTFSENTTQIPLEIKINDDGKFTNLTGPGSETVISQRRKLLHEKLVRRRGAFSTFRRKR